MRITVEIPDREAWHLATVAESRGVKVADMIRAAATQVVAQAARPRDTVRMFVLAGLPDGEISKRTGMTAQAISNHRRALGLPPNRRAIYERHLKESA